METRIEDQQYIREHLLALMADGGALEGEMRGLRQGQQAALRAGSKVCQAIGRTVEGWEASDAGEVREYLQGVFGDILVEVAADKGIDPVRAAAVLAFVLPDLEPSSLLLLAKVVPPSHSSLERMRIYSPAFVAGYLLIQASRVDEAVKEALGDVRRVAHGVLHHVPLSERSQDWAHGLVASSFLSQMTRLLRAYAESGDERARRQRSATLLPEILVGLGSVYAHTMILLDAVEAESVLPVDDVVRYRALLQEQVAGIQSFYDGFLHQMALAAAMQDGEVKGDVRDAIEQLKKAT